MNKRLRFFTGDLHIDDHNALIFDKRPFNSLIEQEKALIKRFNATIPSNGLLYLLGDLGNKADNIASFLKQINCQKIIIKGNHDSFSVLKLLNAGVVDIQTSASLLIHGEVVTLSHFPLLGIKREETSHLRGHEHLNWHGESKFSKIALKDSGQFHLHGHIHSRPGEEERSLKILGRQWDISLPGNKYNVVSESQIESWVMKTKKEEEENP